MPKASTAPSTIEPTSPGERTSPATAVAEPPASAMALALAVAGSSSTSLTTTEAPIRASRRGDGRADPPAAAGDEGDAPLEDAVHQKDRGSP